MGRDRQHIPADVVPKNAPFGPGDRGHAQCDRSRARSKIYNMVSRLDCSTTHNAVDHWSESLINL